MLDLDIRELLRRSEGANACARGKRERPEAMRLCRVVFPMAKLIALKNLKGV